MKRLRQIGRDSPSGSRSPRLESSNGAISDSPTDRAFGKACYRRELANVDQLLISFHFQLQLRRVALMCIAISRSFQKLASEKREDACQASSLSAITAEKREESGRVVPIGPKLLGKGLQFLANGFVTLSIREEELGENPPESFHVAV